MFLDLICWKDLIRRFLFIYALTFAVVSPSLVLGQDFRAEYTLPLDDAAITAKWNELDQAERDKIALRNLHGLVRAIHKYHDVHGTFPPTEVPNSELPPEKRLSGFVLLLPYLGEATYLWQGEDGPRVFDRLSAESAKDLYRSIDLTKAWDDPVNLRVARTLVPALLLPGVNTLRDPDGLALTHVAFVRGYNGKDNGAFTSEPRRISEITDGTVNTLAIGQVNQRFGPWIAAGDATSRFLYSGEITDDKVTFGGSNDFGCFFVNCDSGPYFLDLSRTSAEAVGALSTAADGKVPSETDLARFDGEQDWTENRRK